MSEVETPSAVYLAARREWNERYGSLISRERWWRWTAAGAIGACVVLALVNAWQSVQSKVVPYVVEVNKLGESLPVHRLAAAPPVDARQIKAQLARWVVDSRSIYTDRTALVSITTEALAWVDSASDALPKLQAWWRTDPPTARAERETVGVAIESVGPIGADTWQVDFSEDHRFKNGAAPVTSFWRATIRIKIYPPTDDATILVNPTGLYVTWFQVTARISR